MTIEIYEYFSCYFIMCIIISIHKCMSMMLQCLSMMLPNVIAVTEYKLGIFILGIDDVDINFSKQYCKWCQKHNAEEFSNYLNHKSLYRK